MRFILLVSLIISSAFGSELPTTPVCSSERLQKNGFDSLKTVEVVFLAPVAASNFKTMYINMDTLGYIVALKNCSLIFLEKDKKTKHVLVDKLTPCTWDNVASESMDYLGNMKSLDEKGKMMPNFGKTICHSLSKEAENACNSICMSNVKKSGGKATFCSVVKTSDTCGACCDETK